MIRRGQRYRGAGESFTVEVRHKDTVTGEGYWTCIPSNDPRVRMSISGEALEDSSLYRLVDDEYRTTQGRKLKVRE